jgi:hypothetical protein
MVARHPEREALVAVHQGAATPTARCRPRPIAWPARCWGWAWRRATASASGRTTTPNGC